MMSLYAFLLVTHVAVAVIGLGSISSVALVATVTRRAGNDAREAAAWVRPLLRYAAFCLAAMLATGILLDLATGGAFREWWWFRGSALLLVATGVLNGQAQRTARAMLTATKVSDGGLRRIERLAYGMCGLITAIVALMEIKPF